MHERLSSSALNERIARSGGQLESTVQAEMLGSLLAMYREVGVLDQDTAHALHQVCPSARECWSKAADRRPQGVAEGDPLSRRGCIFLPWIGPEYRPGGIVVLGLNLRIGDDAGRWDLSNEFRISRAQEAALREGRLAHGSRWASHTTRDASIVSRALGIGNVRDQVDALRAMARLQTVKCSPVGGRSSPTQAMRRNCPPLFLRRELQILAPRAMLVYGRAAERAVRSVGVSLDRRSKYYACGTASLVPNREAAVFCLTHPAHGGWYRAHAALNDELRGIARDSRNSDPETFA